jgi:hypothetical protein
VVIEFWGMSPREIFQKLGTEAVKGTFGPDAWVKRWSLSYGPLMDTDDVIVPDVRVDEEANYIRSLGGTIIEVRRGAGLVGSTGNHVSELGLSTLPSTPSRTTARSKNFTQRLIKSSEVCSEQTS